MFKKIASKYFSIKNVVFSFTRNIPICCFDSFVDPTNPTMVKKKNHHLRQANSTPVSSNNDVFVTPHPVVLNRGRKVKNSLQRLEKEQDELFEL